MTDNRAPEASEIPDWTPDNPRQHKDEVWIPAEDRAIVAQVSATGQTQRKWVIPASVAAGFLLAGTLGGVGAAVVSASNHDFGQQNSSVLSGQQQGASVPGVPGGSLPQGDEFADQESGHD